PCVAFRGLRYPTSQNLTAGTRLFRAHDPVKVRVGDNTDGGWRRQANLSQWRQAQCSERRVFRSEPPPGGTRCTTQRQPSVSIPHGWSTISKRMGKLDHDVRLANTCTILWWRVEARSCHDHTA